MKCTRLPWPNGGSGGCAVGVSWRVGWLYWPVESADAWGVAMSHARPFAGRPAGRLAGPRSLSDSGDIRWRDVATTEISRRMRMRTRSTGTRAPAQNQSRYATPGVTFANLSRIFEFCHLRDVRRGQEHSRRFHQGINSDEWKRYLNAPGTPLSPIFTSRIVSRARSRGDEEVCRLEFAKNRNEGRGKATAAIRVTTVLDSNELNPRGRHRSISRRLVAAWDWSGSAGIGRRCLAKVSHQQNFSGFPPSPVPAPSFPVITFPSEPSDPCDPCSLFTRIVPEFCIANAMILADTN